MTGKNVQLTDEEMDKLMEEVETEALADNASGKLIAQEESKETAMEEKEAAEAAENEMGDYVCPLTKEYEWGDKKIQSIDLSGLLDMRTTDMEYADRVLAKMGHTPRDKFKDTAYQKHLAIRATGLPVDFFNMLSARDMVLVGAKVYSYFLYG